MKYVIIKYFDYIAEKIFVFDNYDEAKKYFEGAEKNGKTAFTHTLNLKKFQTTQKYWKVN